MVLHLSLPRVCPCKTANIIKNKIITSEPFLSEYWSDIFSEIVTQKHYFKGVLPQISGKHSLKMTNIAYFETFH